jgi:polysaccharide deacetylase 2 family uncharacterized protein YibQ
MSNARRSLSLRKPLIWGSTLALLMVGMVALVWAAVFDSPEKIVSAAFTASLPTRPPAPGETLRAAFTPDPNAPEIEGTLANPDFTEPASDAEKPNKPDLALVDASPLGPLPRIGDDGRRPVQAYARPYVREGDNPRIAIIVTGLGLQSDATNASFHLPGAISLMFSPYAEDLPAYFERARLSGHEVLLQLPLEPPDYPANDPGPHTLRASGTVDANIERLNWILARAPGYFAVGGRGGTFANSPEAAPVMKALAEKGVGMVEIDSDGLAGASRSAGLAYLSAQDWIDTTPSLAGIDQALGDLEAKARLQGYAVGVAEAYPVILKRLVDWASALQERGLSLVPVSAIMLDQAGLTADDNEASNLAQSEN